MASLFLCGCFYELGPRKKTESAPAFSRDLGEIVPKVVRRDLRDWFAAERRKIYRID